MCLRVTKAEKFPLSSSDSIRLIFRSGSFAAKSFGQRADTVIIGRSSEARFFVTPLDPTSQYTIKGVPVASPTVEKRPQ